MRYFKLFFLLGGIFACAVADAGFWATIWGVAPQSSFIFAPVGYHIMDALRGISQPNNLNWLTAVNYKTFIGGTFNNSQRRQVYFLGINRNLYTYKKLSLGYMLGIMHGYNGYLKNSLGPIFGHDPGPIAVVTMRYAVKKHVDLFSVYEGFGLLFGGSYRF